MKKMLFAILTVFLLMLAVPGMAEDSVDVCPGKTVKVEISHTMAAGGVVTGNKIDYSKFTAVSSDPTVATVSVAKGRDFTTESGTWMSTYYANVSVTGAAYGTSTVSTSYDTTALGSFTVTVKDHDWGEWSVASATTMSRTCSRCGGTDEKERAQYTITYVLNGGTNSDENPASFIEGDSVTLASPTRKGYTFAGWYADAALTSPVTAVNTTMTVYADWRLNSYAARFDGNGATDGTMADMTVNYGASKALTANAYSRTGYAFAGWNTASNGTGTSYAGGASVKNLSEENDAVVILYAQWVVSDH